MAESTLVHVVHTEEKCKQKCIIPLRFFEIMNIKVSDYVTLRTTKNLYVCKVYITEDPVTCILVDASVTSPYLMPSKIFNKSLGSVEIPSGIVSFKVSTFDAVTVIIVLKSDSNFVHCDKKAYERKIQSLLQRYVFGKNCSINCSDVKDADILLIQSLVITETFPESHTYGKINKNSKVEIIDVLTSEQMNQMIEFQNVILGGINNSMKILKLNLWTCKSNNVLITGPPGCGKSSFIKKFCSSMKCFFVFIDGIKTTTLTIEKCNEIRDQFSAHLKLFPKKISILVIDHINVLAPYDSKTKSSVFFLLNLMNCLRDLDVSIIGIAVAKSDINSAVSAFFNKEVNLGIPSFEQRKEIFKILAKSMNCDFDFEEVAQMTPGFIAHDISSLIKTAVSAKKVNVQKESEVMHLATEDFKKALANTSPSILKTSVWNVKVKPVYWKDIGGMYPIKQKLQMCVEWPLHNPSLFKKVDLPCPHGVLLFGPPGCCKTTLARGLATECKANFFAANPAQIYSSFVGESEKNITELFYQARLCAPSIIFFDELDSLVSQRKLDSKSQGVGEKVLSCLLNEMDGFGTKVQFQNDIFMQKLLQNAGNINTQNDKVDTEHSNDVIVVAATNRPDLIDDALLRPGRFDIILYVAPPNEEERESILHCLTEKMPLQNVDIKEIAIKAEFFSGADLKSLCNEAVMTAFRQDITGSGVSQENFNEALKKIKPSITRQQLDMYEKLSSKYGTVVK